MARLISNKTINTRAANWLIIVSLLFVTCLVIWGSSQSIRNTGMELFTDSLNITMGDIRLNKVTFARTPKETARGLMYRRQNLAKDEGMVFDYGKEVNSNEHTFWMRNTYIPLGILFTDADMRVLDVIPDMKPLDESPRKARVSNWRYAIEVAPETAINSLIGHRVILPVSVL